VISSIERGRWTGKDSQIQPGDGIKHVGPVNEIRRIQINDDNLKNKDPKGINKPAAPHRTSKVITAITLMAGLTRGNVTIGRRLSTSRVPDQNLDSRTDSPSPVQLSAKHQKMADAVNSAVRDAQLAKQTNLMSTPAFESAIEKCMSQLKLTVMSAADQEYTTLRERIRILEMEMNEIKRENILLRQQQTVDQRTEFEMLMRMSLDELALYQNQRYQNQIQLQVHQQQQQQQVPQQQQQQQTTKKKQKPNHAYSDNIHLHSLDNNSIQIDNFNQYRPDNYLIDARFYQKAPPPQAAPQQQQQQQQQQGGQQQQQAAPSAAASSPQILTDRSNGNGQLSQQNLYNIQNQQYYTSQHQLYAVQQQQQQQTTQQSYQQPYQKSTR